MEVLTIEDVKNKRKKKGVVIKGERRITYNDNKADSIGIALYGFLPEGKQKLVEEH